MSSDGAGLSEDGPEAQLKRAERALGYIRKEVTDRAAQDPEIWNPAFLKGWHHIADHIRLILDNYDDGSDE